LLFHGVFILAQEEGVSPKLFHEASAGPGPKYLQER
jgi:hypothetical protein